MSSIVAVVFAKPPWAGAAKTRLAARLGPEATARVAQAMLQDTVAALVARPGLTVVLSTPDPAADHGVDLERWDQGGGDLGDRIERGLTRALQAASRAVAFGADAPGMPVDHLTRLFEAPGDAVLGPAEDGGFWALRLDRFPAGMLRGVAWSAPTTASETKARLRSHRLRVGAAPTWWDVDTLEDLDRLRREIPRERAPQTHDVLDALGWTA